MQAVVILYCAGRKPDFGTELRRRHLLALAVPDLEHFDLATLGGNENALRSNMREAANGAADIRKAME